MANEAQLRISLQIRKGSLYYQSPATTFLADVNGAVKGGTPGGITVSTNGTNVDLSQLAQPGLCRIQNLEDLGGNYVEVGIHDGTIFHPLEEIWPGEFYVKRLSRNLGEEEDMPGTGTTGVVNNLCIRANKSSVNVLVEAFET